ncbi:Zinc finger protein 676, partial [Acromyrmex echinatior]
QNYHRRYRGKYTCDACGKEYTWKPSLTRHKREDCAYLRKTWICFQCGKRYLWRGSLKNHIRVECGKEPAFKCLLAQMLMSQDNNVEWTQRRASGSSYKMSRGIRKKSIGGDAKYECSRCGKTYKATTSLSRHKRLECGVVPCEVCPICGRRFKHRFVLNAHIVGCERRMNQTIQKKDFD